MPEITSHSKDQRRILFVSIVMMAVVTLLVMLITTWTLYRASFRENVSTLQAIVKTQAELVKAVGRFDALYSADDFAAGARSATIGQLVDALSQYDGFGKTGEIVVAQTRETTLLLDRHAQDAGEFSRIRI